MNRQHRRGPRGAAGRVAGVAAGIVAGALALTACGGATDSAAGDGSTAAAGPAASDIAALFEIGGGRAMYLECSGTGSPTVVLVSGQRGSAEDWSITTNPDEPVPVFEQVAEHTRVCAYDRPGTPVGESFSRSDPAPQPTTAAAMVADLRALLDAAGEQAPYVLVGHSAGGMAARLLAAESPDAVAGLVLVDALSTGLQDAETAEQWEIQRVLLAGDIAESLAEYPDLEQVDADASFAQLRAAPPLRPMPLTVISADQPLGPLVSELIASGGLPAGVPDDFGYVVDEAQRQSQAGLARLVPGAQHLTETDSGHNVHQEQPVLVADAVVQVVERVREQG